MTAIWLTSDTHFGHDNIRVHCHRPFDSVEEMDETIIENWNRLIDKTDLVYHLGDFAWRGREKYYRKALNGRIILIRGNHDRKNVHNLGLFEHVHSLLNTKINSQAITLCHYALRVWHRSHFNAWHLFGHSHGKLCGFGKSFDIGVDANNFEPLSWEEVQAKMNERQDNIGYTILQERLKAKRGD